MYFSFCHSQSHMHSTVCWSLHPPFTALDSDSMVEVVQCNERKLGTIDKLSLKLNSPFSGWLFILVFYLVCSA